MLIDRGFFVENYVGTYGLKYDSAEDATFIISKEVNHAEEGELPLVKKRIFEFDVQDDDYVFLHLANVDITSDDSILSFCNRYGLPYSSQVCYDDESGISQDIEHGIASLISKRVLNPYSRNDTMDRLEFCRLAVQVRSMMELKAILDADDTEESIVSKLIPLLTYLTFYSREFIYEYDETDLLPHTRVMNLQYSFHYWRRVNSKSLPPSEADQIAVFLLWVENVIENPDYMTDSQILSNMTSEDNRRVLQVFKQIFAQDPTRDAGITIRDGEARVETWADGNTYLVGPVKFIINAQNQFSKDKYGRVTFGDQIIYTGGIDELKSLAYDVLRNAVNEGLVGVNPQLILENRTLRGEWKLKHQMEGIYMEFFMELASNSQYRLCANPTCGKFFSASRNRPNKKFCCHECAALQAKRNQRARNKAKDNRNHW